MDRNILLALLVAVEQDAEVVKTTYLTDGDPDDFPASLKTLVDYCDANFISRADAKLIEEAGRSVVYADCICIETTKGLVNTGSDNF